MKEATRYPEDYDGILAGAPAFNRTHLLTLLLRQAQEIHKPREIIAQLSVISMPAKADLREPMFAREIREAEERARFVEKPLAKGEITTIPLSKKLDAVNRAVLKTCLQRAGEPPDDPYLSDPRECIFDPATLQCPRNVDKDDCLTKDQVAAMKVYYYGVVDPSTGAIIHPGNVFGSETNNLKALGLALSYYLPEPPFDSMFKWVFDDDLLKWQLGHPWDWQKFNVEPDLDAIDKLFARDFNTTQTDLSEFKNHGGKLILYSGWADPLIPPQTTINYYNAIAQTMFGSLSAENIEKTQSFARLFMAPGMWHCGASNKGIPSSFPNAGGPGPNAFGGMFQEPPPSFDPQHDLLSALVQWVEKDQAPTSVVATKYKDDNSQHEIVMQRPICAFPEGPRYNGTGNVNSPHSFKCVRAHAPDFNNQKPAPTYGP